MAALFIGNIRHSQKVWDGLASVATKLHRVEKGTRQDFFAQCASGQFDDVKVIIRTFSSVNITGRFDAELINQLPKSVRFICHNGAGYDQVEVKACTAHDPQIRVSNVVGAADDATADTNMFLILGALRNYTPAILAVRAGNWNRHPSARLGHDPRGKTLGIVGMGQIGQSVKAKSEAFGMKTIYNNRHRLPEELEKGAEFVSLDELLARSDVISMNLPLNAATRHTLSDKEFAKMKDGVVIINTARGAVIDEAALVRALDSGKVANCGLDVFENEPEIHPGLINHPSAMILPHQGTSTVETETKMEVHALSNVRSALETNRLRNIVPEQAGLGLGDD